MPGAGTLAPPTDGMAIWSLVFAILGVFCCGAIFGVLAFFMGTASLNRIRQSGGTVGGESLAQVGRWIGLASAILWVLAILVIVLLSAIGQLANR